MNARELAEMAAEETCERMTRAYINAVDACEGEDSPLTPDQKRYVGTALLREVMGLGDDLHRMFTNASVIESWRESTPLADSVERWLSKQDGRRH